MEKRQRVLFWSGIPNRKKIWERMGDFPIMASFRVWYEVNTELSHISEKIYANFHNPSCGTLKRHLFTVRIAKKLFLGLKIMTGNDKKKWRFQTRKNVWKGVQNSNC